MRWVDSDSSILFSRAVPRCSVVVGPLLVADIDPHPRRMPIDGCTQFSGFGGHISRVRFHIWDRSAVAHSVSMCSRVSVVSWQF